AEKVFKLNMEEYPTAANPYDSYADYLLEKGQTDEAKEYFKKSIAIAEKSDKEDEQTRIMSASKGKLAKLEKKDKQLAFLQGDWKVESTGYTDGKEAMTMKSHDKISYNEDVNALLIRHFNAQNESDGIRMIAYDAMDDTFDIAYISPDGMQGIETSTMKMETKSPTEFTFMDKYVSRTGKDVVLK
ncbi:tetratricopeptide repeat protein, partial [Longispora fulva]|uniref:tetratricopeptide repeat protein n=2 Tax=Bacteria TaxID=2 RepID=UPI00363475C1